MFRFLQLFPMADPWAWIDPGPRIPQWKNGKTGKGGGGGATNKGRRRVKPRRPPQNGLSSTGPQEGAPGGTTVEYTVAYSRESGRRGKRRGDGRPYVHTERLK